MPEPQPRANNIEKYDLFSPTSSSMFDLACIMLQAKSKLFSRTYVYSIYYIKYYSVGPKKVYIIWQFST